MARAELLDLLAQLTQKWITVKAKEGGLWVPVAVFRSGMDAFAFVSGAYRGAQLRCVDNSTGNEINPHRA